jgi:hypothetical protein
MISTEIIEKAKALNTEAAELNEKRKQAEWAKKKAEEDLNKALAEYNAKYGTNLGVADIEKAYAAEEKKVQEQIAKVEAEIEAVKNGATEVVEVPKHAKVVETVNTETTATEAFVEPEEKGNVTETPVAEAVVPFKTSPAVKASTFISFILSIGKSRLLSITHFCNSSVLCN